MAFVGSMEWGYWGRLGPGGVSLMTHEICFFCTWWFFFFLLFLHFYISPFAIGIQVDREVLWLSLERGFMCFRA